MDKEGNETTVDMSEAVFTSANEGIATVSADGVVTLVATGTTTVTVELMVFGVPKTATIEVIVQ